jgi:2-keto-4-pentenoate hydratase/2-oxohepta-3-ene-1,7-dioic acid hydratase in catechol pathway
VRIARILFDGAPSWAIFRGAGPVRLAAGDPFGPKGLELDGRELPTIEGASLLAPVLPRKIIGIARNYRKHAAELGQEVSEEPLFFLKAVTALLPPGGAIELPFDRGRVDYEGELGVVIGRGGRNIAPEQARLHVFGYTLVNDVTARALQKAQGHFTQCKGYDTFCPVGPWVETELDPERLRIQTRKNGQLVQDGLTSEMVHPIERLISHISTVMTLEPGDLIATGTPEGIGPLAAGDVVEVAIAEIGVLTNSVREARAAAG